MALTRRDKAPCCDAAWALADFTAPSAAAFSHLLAQAAQLFLLAVGLLRHGAASAEHQHRSHGRGDGTPDLVVAVHGLGIRSAH